MAEKKPDKLVTVGSEPEDATTQSSTTERSVPSVIPTYNDNNGPSHHQFNFNKDTENDKGTQDVFQDIQTELRVPVQIEPRVPVQCTDISQPSEMVVIGMIDVPKAYNGKELVVIANSTITYKDKTTTLSDDKLIMLRPY
jgi:hypothetical protein